MYLADRTWPELSEEMAGESLAVVPLGSTEQHGPHLPLATDHLIAESLARAATERTGHVCTPTVDIGVSSHHRQFHGTLWVDPHAFRSYVESLTRNLTYHGIDRVVYVNAHGGNVEPLREAGRRLRDDRAAYAIEWMWNDSIPDLVEELFEHPGPHGGPKETAMIMHVARELVDEDRLEDARDGGVVDLEDTDSRLFGARTFYDAIDNSENGVFGDQTDATPEKGKELFEAATDQLVALLEWLDDQPFEGLMPEPHVGAGRP
ncbi:creatininase family protein [Halalkaliarchaeum sp. AArc-GB]|uniref:creatininase family protein n=1 Tax=Halalkaliarchaeum sp. AArc-GB TaxID=3074078 RepID=UPI00285510FC|nr:creatininase family protein [Halalkaliarchaeum sp. AArc-GB]MDR5672988.1 creatininase family protein [Halalkaliarchaeum sp. AArc-GB]